MNGDRGRPTFVLLGVHHAREWPSGENAMEFAVDLAKNYGTDTRITDLVNRSRVVVVPVVNVDGFELSRTDGGLIDLARGRRRGTARILGTPATPTSARTAGSSTGRTPGRHLPRGQRDEPRRLRHRHDLNRNYGGYWGGPGASDLFADPTYRGAAAFSEPETQNIRELVSGRQVTTLITNHTFSNLVLRPNGAAPDLVPPSEGVPLGDPFDEAALKALGDEMAAQNGYTSQHAWELYDTTGSTEDWSYNATGGFGYTFEIGPDEFHPPFPEVVNEYLVPGSTPARATARRTWSRSRTPSTRRRTRCHPQGPGRRHPAAAKTFATPTWEGSIQETLNSDHHRRVERQVHLARQPVDAPGRDGPAGRDGVREPVAEQSWTGTTAPLQSTDQEFTVDQDVDLLEINLDWPTPDDLDLEVYRKNADGSLTRSAVRATSSRRRSARCSRTRRRAPTSCG